MDSDSLYQRLKEIQNKLAAEARVEPYMVFQNKVLQAIADIQPSTLEELATIKGMGEKKLVKYGDVILKTLHGSSPSTVSRHEEEKIFSVSEYIDYLNAFLISQRAIIRGEVGRVFCAGTEKNDFAVCSRYWLDYFPVCRRKKGFSHACRKFRIPNYLL